MPALDISRGAPGRIAFPYCGKIYQLPSWWLQETRGNVSQPGQAAKAAALKDAERATRDAMTFVDRCRRPPSLTA